jgi:hypothetical protein
MCHPANHPVQDSLRQNYPHHRKGAIRRKRFLCSTRDEMIVFTLLDSPYVRVPSNTLHNCYRHISAIPLQRLDFLTRDSSRCLRIFSISFTPQKAGLDCGGLHYCAKLVSCISTVLRILHSCVNTEFSIYSERVLVYTLPSLAMVIVAWVFFLLILVTGSG